MKNSERNLARAILRELGVETQGTLPSLSAIRDQYEISQRPNVVARHLHCVLHHIDRLLEMTGADTVSSLTPTEVKKAMGRLRETLSGKTVNDSLVAMKAMLNWAVEHGLIKFNPLASLKKQIAPKVRPRRALSITEVERLMGSAIPGAIYRAVNSVGVPSIMTRKLLARARLKGERNAMIYRIAVYSGLRMDEIRRLTWGDIDLRTRTLYLRTEETKKGKLNGEHGEVKIPLHSTLATALAVWRGKVNFDRDDPVVRVPASLTAKAFHSDRERAGITYRDDRGRVVDFHSLRHTFATWIREYAKGDPKICQELLRHSSFTTTLLYQEVREDELRRAVESLPVAGGRDPGEIQDVFVFP